MLDSIKNVLVVVTSESAEPDDLAAVPYGLSLAQAANAHLTVQSASLKFVLPSGYYVRFASGLVAAENRRLKVLAEAIAERSRQDAEGAGVTCTTQARDFTYPELLATFTALARVHDLTVLDQEPVAAAIDRGLIEAVLTGSGRPLIIVPPNRSAFRSERIIVAWDGSAKAARAVNDAMPFLAVAEAIELVTVQGEKDLSQAVPGASMAHHLAQHGIAAETRTLDLEGGDVAETLRRYAALFNADLLVTGAFVHSRLREMVLGGVTQSLLKYSAVPLFTSY